VKARLSLVALALLGCDDPLAYPQDIDRLRVLGARVSVEGDPSRAWPEPGEALSLEWLVVDPEPEPELGWHFEACPSLAKSRGTPECSGGVFASAAAATLSTAPPRFDFALPAEPGERVLVRGLVCQGALPQSLNDSCPGQLERVLFDVMVGGPERQNANPTLADASLLLDGQPWPAATPSELAQASCAPGDLSAPSGAKLGLTVQLDESDREPLDDPSGLSPPREPLLVSHFATHGRLSRPLSVIEGSASKLSASVPWRAPTGSSGERVRFYFVVRDGRGGADWSARTLCLAP
jgi:hypothetical protein